MATLVAKRHNWLPLPRAGEGWGEGFLHFRTRSNKTKDESRRDFSLVAWFFSVWRIEIREKTGSGRCLLNALRSPGEPTTRQVPRVCGGDASRLLEWCHHMDGLAVRFLATARRYDDTHLPLLAIRRIVKHLDVVLADVRPCHRVFPNFTVVPGWSHWRTVIC